MFGSRLSLSDEMTSGLVESSRARACAEWAQADALVAAADQLDREIDAEPSPMRRLVLRSGVAVTLAVKVGLSEGQVVSRLAIARRVIDRAPGIWAAFRDGRVDEARVREFSSAILKLKADESVARLERTGLPYAETHNVTELRAWLKRFVARLEPEGFNARADEARRERRVEAVHDDDGMGWLNLYGPSFAIAAIDNRLEAGAKALIAQRDPDDERTKAQIRADLCMEWLLSSQHAPASLNIDVALMIPVTALTGSSGQAAESSDGQWGIPTSWATDQLMKHNSFWHRMVIDPVSQDVLAHEYLGYQTPSILRRAIEFRDRTCRGPGCCTPAPRCEMDHREPWPEGTTSGDNLWPLCKRIHGLKGHRVLQWQMPDGTIIPVDKPDYLLAS